MYQPLLFYLRSHTGNNVPAISYFCHMSKAWPISVILFLLVISCERDNISISTDILFSQDTIHFDTVFTTIGSTTRELRVRNPGRKPLLIDHIYLAGGLASSFRLNIDGEAVNEKKDVGIDAGDSLYIFIDAYINPLASNSAVAVTDSIMFEISGQTRKVQLLAWGQDIFLVKNKEIKSETWDNTKPYVIYGSSMVDTSETLIINEGAKVYFHRQASLTIAGSLVVNGSYDSPVLFASDRLEKQYTDIPGQWSGIYFLNTSRGNVISHSVIRNSIYGIKVGEPVNSAIVPDLKLFYSDISHSSISGLSAVKANIQAANNIISHCGYYCIFIEAGGDYTFTHCTFFNRWDYGFRLSSLLHISEEPAVSGTASSQLNLDLRNCVVYGDVTSEIQIIPSENQFTGNYFFDHCLIKLDTVNSAFWSRSRFPATRVNKNPLFIDDFLYDYRPDTLSPLINMGSTLYIADYPLDFREISRNTDGKPDIGAFERKPGEAKVK